MKLFEIKQGSHIDLLKQWLNTGTKHPEDPDDRQALLEDVIQACERRIKEYGYDEFDYNIELVSLSKLKHIQDPKFIHDDSLKFMAKEHHKLDYKQLHRKHDILPILLNTDFVVIDGYHRIASAELNHQNTIPALVPFRKGTGKVIKINI